MLVKKNSKSIKYRLTQSSTSHLLCRDRKNGDYLNHNLNNHVDHGRSRRNAGVNLKPVEEMFDAVEELNQLVSASAGIFSRLSVDVSK